MLRFGIVGCGLIGEKRAKALTELGLSVVAVSDPISDRAQKVSNFCGAITQIQNWEVLCKNKEVDAVIIATTNDSAFQVSRYALEQGKHVLVEKPAARNPSETQKLVELASSQAKVKNHAVIRVGFNHRFHPGFQKAFELLQEGAVGELMYIRARYGHGARVGYEKEWRGKPEISGGGELLDQGVHLIDLCRWLGGEFRLDWGRAENFFWKMPVEDNGFLFLRSPDLKKVAFLHASCTEWKNIFDFEIFGRTGKLQIAGLGRSYGREELRIYKMKPEMGPPDLEVLQFPEEDHSWKLEISAFLDEISGKKTHLGTITDAHQAMCIVYEAYAQSKSGLDARK